MSDSYNLQNSPDPRADFSRNSSKYQAQSSDPDRTARRKAARERLAARQAAGEEGLGSSASMQEIYSSKNPRYQNLGQAQQTRAQKIRSSQQVHVKPSEKFSDTTRYRNAKRPSVNGHNAGVMQQVKDRLTQAELPQFNLPDMHLPKRDNAQDEFSTESAETVKAAQAAQQLRSPKAPKVGAAQRPIQGQARGAAQNAAQQKAQGQVQQPLQGQARAGAQNVNQRPVQGQVRGRAQRPMQGQARGNVQNVAHMPTQQLTQGAAQRQPLPGQVQRQPVQGQTRKASQGMTQRPAQKQAQRTAQRQARGVAQNVAQMPTQGQAQRPVQRQAQRPVQDATQQPIQGQAQRPTQRPMQGQTQRPAQQQIQRPMQGQTQRATQQQLQKPLQGQARKAVQGAAQRPMQGQAQRPIQGSAQQTAQQQAQRPMQGQLQRPAQRPMQGAAQRIVQGQAQRPSQGMAQRPVQGQAQRPVQQQPQQPTQQQSQRPMQRQTQRPMQGAVQRAAQGAAQRPMQGAAQRPVQGQTQRKPQGAAPSVQLPKIKKPEINLPEFKTPQVSLPKNMTRRGFVVGASVIGAAAVVGGGIAWANSTAPIKLKINGQEIELKRNANLQEAFEAAGSPAKPGNLLDIYGETLEEGAGHAFEAVADGQQLDATNAANISVNEYAEITFSDGSDITEESTVDKNQSIAPEVIDEGSGSLHIMESAGEDGAQTVETGNISGKQLIVEVTKQPINRVFKRCYANVGDEKVACLTFDDGPWDNTNDLLDVLKENDAKATFFVVGSRITGTGVDAVKREVEEGHQVATHTYDHAAGSGQSVNLSFMTAQEQRDEITKGFQAITDAVGSEQSRVMRAPGGNFPTEVWNNVYDLIDADIRWDIDTTDWEKPGVDAIVQSVSALKPGDIILMHDGGGDRSQTVEAMRKVLPKLTKKGWKFITIDELRNYPVKDN